MSNKDIADLNSWLNTHKNNVEAEFEEYYSSFDPCTQQLLLKLENMLSEGSNVSSYELKTRMYELLSENCPVHLFDHTDFFFEISSGRPRNSWGGLQSPVGSFLHSGERGWWIKEYLQRIKKDCENSFFSSYNPVSFDHHCPGYDKILTVGLNGIINQAEAMLKDCKCEKKQEFYRCAIRANNALKVLAKRFAEEAEKLEEKAEDPKLAAHFNRIAQAAKRVPANPASSFYEGLCAILFYRECVSSLEGIGFSTFGQVDRMLYPLYKKDIEKGIITKEEAFRLICDLLLYTEVRFDAKNRYWETSTTIELGGCDREGNVIYNELTEMILDAVVTLRTIDTKINCRISKNHPKAFLEKLAKLQMAKLPSFMMHNDDVLIPAKVRCGQKVEDARMYVGGGCHEIVLQGTEVCTRADSWVSLPRILLHTMEHGGSIASFESFYAQFTADVKAYHEKIAEWKNISEAHWCEYDPLVLYSSSMDDCLEKGMDVTEGGARYNNTSISMLGTATLIDSLYAIKQIVYEEGKCSLSEFYSIVSCDFSGYDSLRKYIVEKIPKHGTNNEVLDMFSAKVLSDLSKVAGQKNARGGLYLPVFYPHDLYRDMGIRLGATPDGRKANTPLSRGVSPSEFVKTESPLDLIHSLRPIDFTQFADSFITEMTLPEIEDEEQGVRVLTSVIEGFLDAEGSSLQFNMIDRNMLLEAQKCPEQHKNLIVRVCGYSAAFVHLNKQTQDEIVLRAAR
ncbi:MAG: hypothetical protein E7564_07950 [Ruminococcaceae bacterium]|nr:hypothetical protein [Oscillospiraceae bacterium]